MRRLLTLTALAACVLTGCNGGSKAASGSTTTTDATAYATAYSVCLQLNNTDAARNAEPAPMTDDQADAVFVGLALQLKPASAKDPVAWGKLQKAADNVRKQLLSSTSTDDQIEKAITKMIDECTKAHKRPASVPSQNLPVTPNPTSPTSALSTTTTP